MAKFRFNGIDGLMADFDKLATVDEETKWSILEAGAKIVRLFHQQEIIKTFTRTRKRTGALAQSIQIIRKDDDGDLVARVTPQGKHPKTTKDGKPKPPSKRMKMENGKRRSAGTYDNSNAEIAYILEYGSPRIPARHWMENANEKADESITEAMQEAWDQHVKDCGF